MGLACYLSVHQCDGVVFDDLAALNEKLSNKTGVGELVNFYNDDPAPTNFDGWIKQTGGRVSLSRVEGHKFAGYFGCVEVWYCWDYR